MIWYKLENGVVVTPQTSLNKDNQVTVAFFRQGIRIVPGTYTLYLFYTLKQVVKSKLKLKLAEIEYDGNENNDWVKIPQIKWVNITRDDISEFRLLLKNNNANVRRNTTADNWMFLMYVKSTEESGEGIIDIESIEPSVKFCTEFTTTVGDKKVLGAECPIDPDTGKSMEECLNWRRKDALGDICYGKTDLNSRKESIARYCREHPSAPDCKCVNRRNDLVYKERQPTETKPDYCWYSPCKNGAFLLDKEGDTINCDNNECKILYNNQDDDSSGIGCFNLENHKPTVYNSSRKRIIIILSVLIVLFILLN